MFFNKSVWIAYKLYGSSNRLWKIKLILKDPYKKDTVEQMFKVTDIKFTRENKFRLGAALIIEDFWRRYAAEKVLKYW